MLTSNAEDDKCICLKIIKVHLKSAQFSFSGHLKQTKLYDHDYVGTKSGDEYAKENGPQFHIIHWKTEKLKNANT